MKYLKLFSFLIFCFSTAMAQNIKIDSTEIEKNLEIKDTMAQVSYQLEEVLVTNRAYNFKSEDERKQFMILQKRVMRTYPYAKLAAERLVALNQGMSLLKSDRDKKKYFKIVENYLTNEFEEKLKKLSTRDGQILIKLIHRQTGITTFDLIHDLKSGWKAFWANNTAHLFNIDLKRKYEPALVAEDYLIESILYRSFIDGRLVKQPSKPEYNYNDLTRVWREKRKSMMTTSN
jgi:ABC-type transporter MlaC component